MWFPTGYGNSLCYQLLPFLFDHKHGRIGAPEVELSVVVVVQPGLKSRGVSAAILSGNLSLPVNLQYIFS